jgi:hypothetical protein
MTTAAVAGPPDPRKSLYIFASGKKGTGKSYVCRSWWDSYPFDRMAVDPTHDIRADLQKDGEQFDELDMSMLPARLPAPADTGDEDARRRSWLVCPDMGSKTWEDDVDRAIGLCLGRGRPMLLWVDEFGTVTRGSKTGPNMRRALHHGRHDDLSLLLACPRPKDVEVLGIAQADLVYTFRTPQVYDRQTIADTIGVDRGEFDEVNEGLQGHEHTLYDARTDELFVMPPLPARRRGINARAPVPS